MDRPRILLVDDDDETGRTLAAWLERQGCDVAVAIGPDTADVALGGGGFDLVLSDIQMPGNFRLEWIEGLFRAECPPPVVLMTGSPELETAMRAANLPIAAYLLKPLDYPFLWQTLSRLVAQQRRHREFRALAGEISALLGAAPPGGGLSEPAVAGRLHTLARTFVAESARDFRAAPADAPWRSAISDTIAVLEKTKHSFRSRELGQLRHRLEGLLESPAVDREPAARVTA